MIQKVILTDPVVFVYDEMQSAEWGQKYKTDKNGNSKLDYEYVEIKFKDPEKESVIIKGLHDCDYMFLEEFINKILQYENFKDEDEERYTFGNYFKTEKEAQKYAEYIKKYSLEWHEKREENE